MKLALARAMLLNADILLLDGKSTDRALELRLSRYPDMQQY